MPSPCTIANSQTDRMPTKINKKWCYCQSKSFSGTRDTIRDLVMTFRVISKEMPVLLLILCWCCFSCRQMYSDKFFDVYFSELMFFEIFVAKGGKSVFFVVVVVVVVFFFLRSKSLGKCFFRLSQNVILRIINLRSSVGILWNPLLTGIYQVCS